MSTAATFPPLRCGYAEWVCPGLEVRPVSQVNNRVFSGPGRYMPEGLPTPQLRRNHHRVAGAQPVQRFRAGNQIALLHPPPAQGAAVAPNPAGRGVPGRGSNPPFQIAVVEVRGAFPSLKPPAEVVYGHRDALRRRRRAEADYAGRQFLIGHISGDRSARQHTCTSGAPRRGPCRKRDTSGSGAGAGAVCTQASTWAGSHHRGVGGRGRQALAQLVEFRRVWRKKTFQGGIAQVNHIPLGFLPEPLPGLRQGFAVNRVSRSSPF